MFKTIDLWKASNLTQVKFCAHEELSVKTFGYWLRKYKNEKGVSPLSKKKVRQGFIPIKVSPAVKTIIPEPGWIEVSFPNGVRLSCSAGIDTHQLKTLINF